MGATHNIRLSLPGKDLQSHLRAQGNVRGVSESLMPVYFCGLCLGPGNRRFRREAADWKNGTKTSRSHVSPELHRAGDPPSTTDKHL